MKTRQQVIEDRLVLPAWEPPPEGVIPKAILVEEAGAILPNPPSRVPDTGMQVPTSLASASMMLVGLVIYLVKRYFFSKYKRPE